MDDFNYIHTGLNVSIASAQYNDDVMVLIYKYLSCKKQFLVCEMNIQYSLWDKLSLELHD